MSNKNEIFFVMLPIAINASLNSFQADFNLEENLKNKNDTVIWMR